MKLYLLFILACLMLENGIAQNNIGAIPPLKKLNVFQQHIKLLDSICRFQNCFDPNNSTYKSVQFMERVTHIKAHVEGTWAGLIAFSPSDLALWKNWYKNIGSKKSIKTSKPQTSKHSAYFWSIIYY